jgi:hypothetical protein
MGAPNLGELSLVFQARTNEFQKALKEVQRTTKLTASQFKELEALDLKSATAALREVARASREVQNASEKTKKSQTELQSLGDKLGKSERTANQIMGVVSPFVDTATLGSLRDVTGLVGGLGEAFEKLTLGGAGIAGIFSSIGTALGTIMAPLGAVIAGLTGFLALVGSIKKLIDFIGTENKRAALSQEINAGGGLIDKYNAAYKKRYGKEAYPSGTRFDDAQSQQAVIGLAKELLSTGNTATKEFIELQQVLWNIKGLQFEIAEEGKSAWEKLLQLLPDSMRQTVIDITEAIKTGKEVILPSQKENPTEDFNDIASMNMSTLLADYGKWAEDQRKNLEELRNIEMPLQVQDVVDIFSSMAMLPPIPTADEVAQDLDAAQKNLKLMVGAVTELGSFRGDFQLKKPKFLEDKPRTTGSEVGEPVDEVVREFSLITRAFHKAGEHLNKELPTAVELITSRLSQVAMKIGGAFGAAVSNGVAMLTTAIAEEAPKIAQLANDAVQGFQSGGIWGAIIAVVARLLTFTKTFSGMLERAEKSLEPLIGMIDGIVGFIGPLDKGFHDLWQSVGGILANMAKLTSTFNPLTWALKALGWAFTKIADLVKEGYNWIISKLAKIVKSIPGIGKALSRELRDAKLKDEEVGLEAFGTALDDSTKKLKDFTGILNEATGFKYALRKYQSEDPTNGDSHDFNWNSGLAMMGLGQYGLMNTTQTNIPAATVSSGISLGQPGVLQQGMTQVSISNVQVNQPQNVEELIRSVMARIEFADAATQSANPAGNGGVPNRLTASTYAPMTTPNKTHATALSAIQNARKK